MIPLDFPSNLSRVLLMNTSPAATAALDNAVAVLMNVQRDRVITKAAADLGISKRQADTVARMMGR